MKSRSPLKRRARAKRKASRPSARGKSLKHESAEARRLLAIVEKSQVPLGESSTIFSELKTRIDEGHSLTVTEHQDLLKLVKLAKDWEKAEESSAGTEREETMAG